MWLCDLTHPPHPPLAAAQEAELAFGAAGAPPEAQLGPHNDMETEQLLSTALLGDVGPLDGAFVR